MIWFTRRTVEGQERPRRRVGCLGGCLIFFAVYFLCSAILGWIMGDMFSSGSVTLKDKTVYRLQLKGTLVEQAQKDNPFAGLMGSVPPLEDLLKMAGMSLPSYLKGNAEAAPATEPKTEE